VDLLGKEKVGNIAKGAGGWLAACTERRSKSWQWSAVSTDAVLGAGVMRAVRESYGRKHYHEIRRAGGTMLGEARGGYPGPSTIVLPAPA
jgi:hypothetical protein